MNVWPEARSGCELRTLQGRQRRGAARAQRAGNDARRSPGRAGVAVGLTAALPRSPGIAPELISPGFVSLGTALR